MHSTPWQQLAETSRDMAETFLRTGNCRWIDVAFSEGWERSLRDLVRTAIQQQVAKGGPLPTLAQLDRFPMASEDHVYFRGNGQKLMSFEREEIIASRRERASKRQTRTQQITGEANSGG